METPGLPLWSVKGATGVRCGVVSTHRDMRALSTAQLKKVADVAIVAGIGRRIPVFAIAALEFINRPLRWNLRLTPARASVSSMCDLALRKVRAIVIIQLILLPNTTAVNA